MWYDEIKIAYHKVLLSFVMNICVKCLTTKGEREKHKLVVP